MNNYFNYIKLFKPNWINSDIQIKKISYGLSNINFKITNICLNETYLLRIYNNNLNDINKELFISEQGFGAKILFTFDEGRIESWIDGRIIDHKDLTSIILKKIAYKLANFHLKIGYNHNDLNFTNIMLTIDNEIKFIDFEYSNNLDNCYDIANFFCEWIYNYKKDWYLYDLSLFPSLTQINIFCKAYLSVYEKKKSKTILKNFINSIFSKLNNVHQYWIKWAENYEKDDYKMYQLYRRKLINIDIKQYIKTNKIIYCDGVFDIIHNGHLNFFKKIRSFGCKKLIVGVISDKDVQSYKKKPNFNSQDRGSVLKNIFLIDQVIIDCPFNSISSDFLDDYGIDLVIYGCNPNNLDPLGNLKNHYQVAIDRNIFKLVDYTLNYSTTSIIKNIKEIDIF